MCVCTPEVRTPWCGKPGCEMPKQVNEPEEELKDTIFAKEKNVKFKFIIGQMVQIKVSKYSI